MKSQADRIEPTLSADRILVGRESEMKELVDEFLATGGPGGPRVVTVEGEAGLGKSTLVKDFLERIQELDADVRVAYGTSTARLSAVNGYEPVRQALADLSSRAANGQRFKGGVREFLLAVRESAPDWLPAIPVIGDVLAAGASIATTTAGRFATPPTLEEPVPRQFVRVINDTVRTGPLILVLDDLHWADASTIELVHLLATSVDAGRFMLVLCYRPFDVSHEVDTDKPHPLKERLLHIARYKKLCRISLNSLETSAVQLIWRANTTEQLPRSLAARIEQICAGNPLFINEYIGLILDRFKTCSNVVERNSVVENLERDMPQAVDAVIQARLMHLSKHEARTIEVASVLGLTFDPDELVALCESERGQTLEVLRSLCRMHNILRPFRHPDGSARYQFEHQTLQSVVELKLEREDLFDFQELHLRAGHIVSGSHGGRLSDLTRAAHHFWEAGERDVAAEFALKAGEAAAALGAYTEIVELTRPYTRNAEAIERSGKDMAACAMKALLITGDQWAVLQIWDMVPVRWKDEEELLSVAARAQRMANRWAEAESSVQRLLSTDRSVYVRAAALMLMGEIHLCGKVQRAPEAIEVFLEAIHLDPRPQNKYRGEGHIGLAHLSLGNLDAAWTYLKQAVETSDDTSSPHDVYEARHWLGKACMAEMRLDEAEELLRAMAEISQKSGMASTVPFHLRDSGRVAALRNDIDEASALYLDYLQASALETSREPRDRALADIALQVIELATLGGHHRARQFVSQLSKLCTQNHSLTASELDRLGRWAVPTGAPTSNSEITSWVAEAFPLATQDIAAADAIFRFDIPDFWIRRLHQRSSLTASPKSGSNGSGPEAYGPYLKKRR